MGGVSEDRVPRVEESVGVDYPKDTNSFHAIEHVQVLGVVLVRMVIFGVVAVSLGLNIQLIQIHDHRKRQQVSRPWLLSLVGDTLELS